MIRSLHLFCLFATGMANIAITNPAATACAAGTPCGAGTACAAGTDCGAGTACNAGTANPAAAVAQSPVRKPTFDLPQTILAGRPLAIRLNGLPPEAIVKVTARRIAGWRNVCWYQSSVSVQATAAGVVDLSQQAPRDDAESSYQGVEPLGMLWAMQPVNDETVERPAKDMVTFTAHVQQAAESTLVAEGRLQVVATDAKLEEFPLTADDQLEGAFVMMPPTEQPLPVIITLGGSEGGDMSARRTAPGLAARGFAVVGLPYYSPAYGEQPPQFASLPQSFTEIPLDRLERAIDAIDRHPLLDGQRIGLHGVSKGGEYVLAIASRLDRFQAVAAIVPSDVIWEGWGGEGRTSSFSYRGQPLPYVPYKGMQETVARLSRGEPADMRTPHDAGRTAHADRLSAARIKVEHIKAAVMVVGGDRDRTWDSGGMCRRIVATRRAAGLSTTAWIDENAGHYLSGHAFFPMSYAPADASLRTRTYPAMIQFFRQHLAAEE